MSFDSARHFSHNSKTWETHVLEVRDEEDCEAVHAAMKAAIHRGASASAVERVGMAAIPEYATTAAVTALDAMD
jgi:hypothetical protein